MLAWLEVELAEASTISRLVIKELNPRLSSFQLQHREQPTEAWKVAHQGTKAGTDFSVSFSPQRARCVPLNTLDSTRPPTIGEFQVSAPCSKPGVGQS